MCEKAKEIQALKKPDFKKEKRVSPFNEGDWVLVGEDILLIGGYCNDIDYYKEYKDKAQYSNAGYVEGMGYTLGEDEKVIWIPKQDQLQKLTFTDCTCQIDWLHKLGELKDFAGYICEKAGLEELDYYTNIKGTRHISLREGLKKNLKWCDPYKSWEQFWLCFVMKEKYNKIWSDEENDWIKNNG